MNCTQAKRLLVELLYDELPSEREASLRSHLETCTSCRDEWVSISGTKQLLDRTASQAGAGDSSGSRLDVASIHQSVAARAQVGRRRWQRVAVVAGTIAALLLVAVVNTLHVQFYPTHFVVGRGEMPAGRRPPLIAAPTTSLRPLLNKQAEQLERLDELMHVLTRELLSTEDQRSAEIAELRGGLVSLQEQLVNDMGDLQKQSDLRWQLILNELSQIAADTELADASTTQLHLE